MRSARIEVAGVDYIALRVSFTGDLGWELHCAEADQARLYTALLDAGKLIGAGPVGSRALMSLRVEKGYGSWGRDYSPEYWPQETGLGGWSSSTNPDAAAALPVGGRQGAAEIVDAMPRGRQVGGQFDGRGAPLCVALACPTLKLLIYNEMAEGETQASNSLLGKLGDPGKRCEGRVFTCIDNIHTFVSVIP